MLISQDYQDQLLKMRAKTHRPNWGNGGTSHVPRVQDLIEARDIITVLDYGAGHGILLKELIKSGAVSEENAQFYDPGIPEYSDSPVPADLVVSTDVMEHIEPEYLDEVLNHLSSLTLHRARVFRRSIKPLILFNPVGGLHQYTHRTSSSGTTRWT